MQSNPYGSGLDCCNNGNAWSADILHSAGILLFLVVDSQVGLKHTSGGGRSVPGAPGCSILGACNHSVQDMLGWFVPCTFAIVEGDCIGC